MINELVLNDLAPNETFEEMCRRKIQNLLEFSPSDACATARLQKVKEGYEGILSIFSTQGSFLARAVSTNLNDVMKNLSRQIHEQITEWRVARFN